MPTKHQLEQQLDEVRADLEAERERGQRARDREIQLSAELRLTTAECGQQRERANKLAEMLREADERTQYICGQLDGMREALTCLGLFGAREG